MTSNDSPRIKIEVYRDETGKQFRARIVARNGKILFVTGESYHNLADVKHAVDLLIKGMPSAKYEENI